MQGQGVVLIRTSASGHLMSLGSPETSYIKLCRTEPKTFAVWDDSRACNQHRLEVVYLLYLSRFSSHLLNQSGVYGLSMFQSSLKFLNA